ncbi:PREDICTED: uncharacterized protein LOC109469572 [Branchiostoma belcheri]|uniref:Uncharacterized protein LOC109469572 n=1 Tax=Branchiostoma belcheri TaxID=7741 RepID=A0A6P4Y3U4_BRABE|nr:PREDICTED: uncharacterized protein LOC109469572 [Branchiostoma belcheri]
MVLSSAPLPPQHMMMAEPSESKVMADPQPQAPQVPVGPAQSLFGQNQQEPRLGGVQNTVRRARQQGMQFRFPEAGGVQGSVQYRPQYHQRSSCQPGSWNTVTTSDPQEPLMRIPGDQNLHGNSSPWQASWNPPQSRIPPSGKSVWSVPTRSQESRRSPHTAVLRAATTRGGEYSGTFGTLPAHQHRQYWGPTADRRVPSAGSGASSRHRRRKRPSSEDEGPSSKMFLSEEKMAAHLNKLSISNDHNYVGMTTRLPGSSRLSPAQDKNRVIIEDLSDDSSDEWTSSSDSEVGSTIQISPELQEGMKQVAGERLLPEGLFERLNRPCMDVVLWKPPGDFVQSVINSSTAPKEQITPTVIQSEPLLLTQDNSSVICNHGDREMIDTEVMDHVTQPAVMFDSVDDDMEL